MVGVMMPGKGQSRSSAEALLFGGLTAQDSHAKQPLHGAPASRQTRQEGSGCPGRVGSGPPKRPGAWDAGTPAWNLKASHLVPLLTALARKSGAGTRDGTGSDILQKATAGPPLEVGCQPQPRATNSILIPETGSPSMGSCIPTLPQCLCAWHQEGQKALLPGTGASGRGTPPTQTS